MPKLTKIKYQIYYAYFPVKLFHSGDTNLSWHYDQQNHHIYALLVYHLIRPGLQL